MKNVKYELLDFALYDYQFVQRHLTELAAKGWRLEKVSSFGVWHYRRAEPAKVRYEVTYAPSASAYNSRPTAQEEALADICAEAGWVKTASVAQLHIYCNEDPNATPLETDELSRIRTLRKAMNRHFVPQYLLLAALFVLQFAMHLLNAIRWPVTAFSSPLMVGNLVFMPTLVLIYLAIIGGYLHWVRRAERAAAEGLVVPECVFYRHFRFVLWLFLAGYLTVLLMSAGLWILGAVLAFAAVAVAVTGFTMHCCKEMGAPKWVNILVPFLATFLALMLLMPLIFGAMDTAYLSEEPEHPESLPLMLSDLTGEENTERTILEESASPLATYCRYRDESEAFDLAYTIIDTKVGFAWELCLNYQEQQFLDSATIFTGSVITLNQGNLWGAEYARRAPGEGYDRWLICWEDRIVSLRANWTLTDEQIAIAAELLNP